MTILVSTVTRELIIMLSDSVITTTHFQEDGNYFVEYEESSKYYKFPGIGCITTWGDQTYNQLGRFLQGHPISKDTHTIVDLANLVLNYLNDIFPKDLNLEIGFHVGGFDRDKCPRLFHVFWGYDRPRPPDQEAPGVHLYDHSDWVFLYNGRNDLAHSVIATLYNEIINRNEIRFELSTAIGRISFCDFIARFAAEMTPQVGPPFVINLVFSDNNIERVVNPSLNPINVYTLTSVLPKLVNIKITNENSSIYIEQDNSISRGDWGGSPTGTSSDPQLSIEMNPASSPGTITKIPPSGVKDGSKIIILDKDE